MSLQETDRAAAANAKAPRVSLTDIADQIAATYYTTADRVLGRVAEETPLKYLTLCFVVMKNGFVVIGKSAPASPENFNPDLGQKFAYEDAVRQLWPLMGYELRQRLHQANGGNGKKAQG